MDREKLRNDPNVQTSLRWLASDTKMGVTRLALMTLRALRLMKPEGNHLLCLFLYIYIYRDTCRYKITFFPPSPRCSRVIDREIQRAELQIFVDACCLATSVHGPHRCCQYCLLWKQVYTLHRHVVHLSQGTIEDPSIHLVVSLFFSLSYIYIYSLGKRS